MNFPPSTGQAFSQVRRLRLWVIAFSLSFLCGTYALAQTNAAKSSSKSSQQPKPAATTAPQPTADMPPANLNALTQAAWQQGVRKCAARIQQVSQFLGYAPATTGAMFLPSPGQPDNSMLSISMELHQPDATVYVATTFVPNQANGCGASYDAVVYWPLACADVAKRQFAGTNVMVPMQQSIAVLDNGAASKIFLMPAGPQGCVSIKREVVLS